MPISERVAYHEAGHALLVFLIDESSVIEVRIFEPPLELILGLTMFEKDKFISFITDKGKEHAKNLIKIAWGGCIAEEIYDRTMGQKELCSYGDQDMRVIKELLKSMSIGDTEYHYIREDCKQVASSLLNQYSNQLAQIAALFKSGKKSSYSYADISEIMRPMR